MLRQGPKTSEMSRTKNSIPVLRRNPLLNRHDQLTLKTYLQALLPITDSTRLDSIEVLTIMAGLFLEEYNGHSMALVARPSVSSNVLSLGD